MQSLVDGIGGFCLIHRYAKKVNMWSLNVGGSTAEGGSQVAGDGGEQDVPGDTGGPIPVCQAARGYSRREPCSPGAFLFVTCTAAPWKHDVACSLRWQMGPEHGAVT